MRAAVIDEKKNFPFFESIDLSRDYNFLKMYFLIQAFLFALYENGNCFILEKNFGFQNVLSSERGAFQIRLQWQLKVPLPVFYSVYGLKCTSSAWKTLKKCLVTLAFETSIGLYPFMRERMTFIQSSERQMHFHNKLF